MRANEVSKASPSPISALHSTWQCIHIFTYNSCATLTICIGTNPWSIGSVSTQSCHLASSAEAAVVTNSSNISILFIL